LLTFYIFVMIITSVSLILIIRNAFLLSMQTRLRQLGILQSIGATPRQIRICILQEALVLCLVPILVGIGGGVGLCLAIIRLANTIAGAYRGENAIFSYHVGLFILPFIGSIFTVLFSAWLPARKLSKQNPLQLISGEEEYYGLQKEKKSSLISTFFGIEGELAKKSLYVRRKSLRMASLSLTLSFFAFSIFLCFLTLSGISTKYTYFERYKDVWDIMATVKNQQIDDMEDTFNINRIEGVESCRMYQKALTYTWLTTDMLSDELQAIGGISALAGQDVILKDGKYRIEVPIVILDDASFRQYCENIEGYNKSAEWGMITVNRIWDSIHSNYRNKEYLHFVKEEVEIDLTLLQSMKDKEYEFEVPILAYTDELPVLREEYSNYALVQVMSASSWEHIATEMDVEVQETYINVQTLTDNAIKPVQTEMEQLLNGTNYEIENRIEEESFNKELQRGYTLIIGGLCGLLAMIGLANVFSNTLGMINTRKREFARYITIGLTPHGVRKILCMEALMIGGKPIIITIPLTIAFVLFATSASYINPMEFVENMPLVPLLIMAGMIMGCVALAYYIGGRKLYRNNLMETLKNDIQS
ncbi:MAG: ABC-type transport system, involved in lipoprotein release, permease component, partial [Herbinix sp.]|nr:ABC-type transport system, involved in lipoprotein release, permease component [Herbinix sp.]